MAVVVFNPVTFKARYPAFAATSEDLLAAYFSEAGLYCNNTTRSIITDETIRGMILNMLTAHIAALDTTNLVGRVSSASEGSVSVSTAMAPPTGSRAWFDQTKYGAAAWQAMSPYRRAIYLPPPTTTPTYVPRG